MVKTVFYACSAWVGRIDGETRCRFWSQNPLENNFDPVLLVPVDLSRTPTAARLGKIDWDEVEVDDFGDLGHPKGTTTIGPRFPDGKTTGMVSLSTQYLRRLRPDIRPVVPPPSSSALLCEFTSVVYGDGDRKGLRYVGLHAVAKARSGSRVQVEFQFKCPQPKLAEHWFDLNSPEVDAHVDKGGLTQITADENATGAARNGALFVEFERAVKMNLVGLKVPLACGLEVPFDPIVEAAGTTSRVA